MPPPIVKKQESRNVPGVLEVKNTDSFVYVEKSITKKTGDYESAKVTIGVQLPVNPTKEDIKSAQDAMNIAIELVDETIVQEITLILDEQAKQ